MHIGDNFTVPMRRRFYIVAHLKKNYNTFFSKGYFTPYLAFAYFISVSLKLACNYYIELTLHIFKLFLVYRNHSMRLVEKLSISR